MATYEQDPDVVKWGLQLFDGNPYENSGYYGTMMQNNQLYHQQYCQDHYGAENQHDNNDELNAHSLQEELSQLTVAEPAENIYDGVGYHASSYGQAGQHWYPQPVGGYDYEVANDHVEVENIGQSDSCSSPEGETFDQEWAYPLELIDEYDIEGEVGKRFNQMISIPHIPKINGEIPSIDEATLDHQRLLHRLQLYELTEVKVQGDGNCQFRALSDQFYRTPEHHKFVRQQVINQLRSFPDNYEAYVPMAYNDYLKKMSKNGEWGDHVTLQAAADSYGVKIFVITSFKDTCYIEILPSHEKSERVICLSFWAEVHYNSVYPEGDMHKRSEGAQDESWESQDNYD